MPGPTSAKSPKDIRVEQAEGRAHEQASQPALSGPHANILAMQGAAGNQALSQLLQPDAGETSSMDSGGPVKLAENSLLKPLPSMATSALGVGGFPFVVRSVLVANGKPLDPELRDSMESRLGYDLGQIRVHSGPQAARSATAVNASAYTVGRDIVFGAGQYAPNTTSGLQLLTHELAHAIQQSPSRQNAPAFSPDSSSERAADAVARGAASATASIPANATGLGIARQFRTLDVKHLEDDELIGEFQMVQARLAEPRSYPERETDELYAQELLEEIAQRGLATSTELEPMRAEEPAAAPNLSASREESIATPRFEAVRQAVGEGGGTSVMKPGKIARPEWNLRAVPRAAEKPLRTLKLNDSVVVDSMLKNPGWTLDWYHVVTGQGESGWMRSDGVALDPPEPSAQIHYVTADEKLIDIAARYYRSEFRRGQDARFYVSALAYANQARAGIIPQGLTDRDWQERTTWREIRVKREHAIWIPDASFMQQLKDLVSSGSITHGLWGKAKAAARFVWDWAKYGAGVIAGILRGALECLYDLFVGVVHLVQAVWSVLRSLVTENIVNDARALWDAITNIDLAGLAEDFISKWDNPDPWDRGMFRGRVLGYVTVEIALAVFSVGALTAAKWAGRFAGVVRRLGSLRKVDEVTTTVSSSRRLADIPEPAARAMRRQFEGRGGTPATRGETPPLGARPVDPEIERMVERGIIEGPTSTGAARRPRPARPESTGRAQAARHEFDRVRDGYANRLGVRSGGQVHHAIELQVLDRYPGAFTAGELNSFRNMRGIDTELRSRRQLHNSKIREMWDRHYRTLDDQIAHRGLQPGTRTHRDYVRQYLANARDEIDHVLGQFFTEYRTGRPRSFK